MSAERFFDDLARTLAEPMPRRRAVRVLGVSLAAIAVPGFRPRIGQAGASACRYNEPNRAVCQKTQYPKPVEFVCCPPPGPRYECGGKTGYECMDTCPPINPIKIGGKEIHQEFCFSTERAPLDSAHPGWPIRSACCIVPDTKCVNGECVVNVDCKRLYGPKAFSCGQFCCHSADYECLNVALSLETKIKKRCIVKCGTGKRRCVSSLGVVGECCPTKFPCCGGSCGCEVGEECVRGTIALRPVKLCRRKCAAPKRRCNLVCCAPDRMRRERLPNGLTRCRCE